MAGVAGSGVGDDGPPGGAGSLPEGPASCGGGDWRCGRERASPPGGGGPPAGAAEPEQRDGQRHGRRAAPRPAGAALELHGQLVGRGMAVLGLGGHRQQAGPCEPPGSAGGPDRVAIEVATAGALERRARVGPVERRPAHEELVEHRPQREDVAARAHPLDLAPRLLGRDVARRATEAVRALAPRIPQPRHPEIDQPRSIRAVDQDVRRLDVPVDDPPAMRRRRGPRRARDNLGRPARRDAVLVGKLPERPPRDVLHHQERSVFVEIQVDHPDQSRMVQPGQEPALGHQALAPGRVPAHPRLGELDDQVLAEGRMDGAIDRPLAPRAQRRHDRILADPTRLARARGVRARVAVRRGHPGRRGHRRERGRRPPRIRRRDQSRPGSPPRARARLGVRAGLVPCRIA